MLDLYKIEGCKNLDDNACFKREETYPSFQQDLQKFKDHLKHLVSNNECKTFYKFGDGDYRFLKKQAIGSAQPGRRALSRSYDSIGHEKFVEGAQLNDYYTCEIYPENRAMFSQVIDKGVDYPAEYGYSLVSNKWFFKKFAGKIGLIGAREKMKLIQELMKHEEYQEYLGLESFNDYIYFPQKYACDDIDAVEDLVGKQLERSSSDIFLLGIGHAKSAILHRFKNYKDAVYLDVGAGIDCIAGCIDIHRPYAGDWTNYRIEGYDYGKVDYLAYQGLGKHITLNK